MSDWNKDMSESMMKLFVYKRQYLECDNLFSLQAERANAMIVLILTLMCDKHGMGFVKILLVNTGLQEVYKVWEE